MTEKDQAQAMVGFIERWLGNPVSRSVLRIVTKRCPRCGRRAENAMEIYATGEGQDLCTGCKVSSFLMRSALDRIIGQTRVDKEVLREHLRNSMWRKGLSSVMEGIAHYGATKPFTAYAPFLVVWNLTRACNLKCRHCYEFAEKPGPDELKPREALEAVDRMAEAGVAYVAVSGGEPLIRKDLWDISRRMKDNGMAFSIATNGTLLTGENVKRLMEHECLFVQVSLDGSNPKSHNWFRGRNSFEQTVRGIKNAVKEGLSVGISTTVTSHNYREVQDIIELGEKLGVGTFMNYNFIPTGRGKDIIDMDLSPDQREELLKSLARQAGKRKMRLLSTAPQYSRVCLQNQAKTFAMTHFDYTSPEMSKSLQFLAEFIGGCGTGRLYCALEPNGDITPCVFIPLKLGNIMRDDLLDVWNNHEVFRKIRDRDAFKGNCGVCEYRSICGGCRARAYAYFRDVQACDPGCVNNKGALEKAARG